jgi:hypothetical protein
VTQAVSPSLLATLERVRTALAAANDALRAGAFDIALPALEDLLAAASELAHSGHRPGRDRAPEAPWDGQKMEQQVWHLLAQLKSAGCTVFPFAGTLLGLQRDGKLLPGDKDADFAVWLEDLGLAARLMQQMGLRIAGNLPPFGNMACLVDEKTGLSVDLFGIRRDPVRQRMEGGVWLYGKPASHQRVAHFPWFTIGPRPGPAGEVWWPQPPAILLRALYGDWLVPQPEWDSLVSCPAVQEFNLQWRCCALKQLADRWLKGDMPRTRRLLDQIVARCGWDAQLERYRDALDAAVALEVARSG